MKKLIVAKWYNKDFFWPMNKTYYVWFMPDVNISTSWKNRLKNEFSSAYFIELINFVKQEYSSHKVYPPGNEIFKAFDKCAFENITVVIIGQDPYHGEGQANGLCFSVKPGVRNPPSLQNIFKEIKSDLGRPFPDNGNLERWAEQGVLLLNATLTVRDSTPGSHQNKGWETFTDAVIKIISHEKEHVVFLLWGAYAQKKIFLIDSSKHYVLQSAHPSPFSADRSITNAHANPPLRQLRCHLPYIVGEIFLTALLEIFL